MPWLLLQGINGGKDALGALPGGGIFGLQQGLGLGGDRGEGMAELLLPGDAAGHALERSEQRLAAGDGVVNALTGNASCSAISASERS